MSELPQGWADTALGDVLELCYGKSLPEKNRAPGNFNVYGSNGVVGCHDTAITDAPAIVVGRKGSIGEVHLSDAACFPIDTTYFVDRFDCADPRFTFHLLRSLPLREMNRASAVPGLNREDAYRLPIALPPLPEQRRIVSKIDSLTSKSKRARDHLDHIPRLVEKYKQAVLAAAFRGDLTREWRERPQSRQLVSPLFGVREQRKNATLPTKRRVVLDALALKPAWPAAVPKNWEWACVEEVASDEPMSIQSGPFGSSLLHSEFTKEGRLVIGIDNVQDGYFSAGSQHRIPEKKFEELKRFQARPEDVLITVMATIGRVCVVPKDIEPAIITKHVYRITVDRRLSLPQYVAFALTGATAALEHMGANVRGQTRPGLNGEIVKAVPLPIPPLSEQLEILRRIDAAFAWIDRLASDATSARKLIDHLDQSVLAKAFRGELVPQDPSDEPASLLLDRIKAERGAAPNTKRGRKT